ncbi:MAG: hypothetical protein KAV00_01980 [Phycisphaerae bacterium]|nr:hypothetical protein [Phycisphaerae bacterium]
MSKQHIPTEFPTDMELLDWLAAKGDTIRNGWICCPPFLSDGWLLKEAREHDNDACATPREAIAAAMGVMIEPSGAGR